MVGWNVVVLAIGAGIIIGGLVAIGASHTSWAAATVPEISTTAVPIAVETSEPIPTETPHSMFMYSTAREMKYRPAGWICTEKSPSYIYNSDGELVGIWCISGYQP